uniref:HD domain-containing phosphohydrolase n=1 Tax=Deinococcus sp. TaxID=47478 RepID=UPI002869C5E7
SQLLNLLDFDHAVYQVWDEQHYVVSHQVIRSGLPVPQPPLHTSMPLDGAFLAVQRTNRTAWHTDYPAASEVIPMMVEQGIKSVVLTPVFSQGRIIATIALRTVHRWHTITPRMRKVVELVALRLEHVLELRRAVGDVRATLEGSLLMLGVALEARDLETHGHTERATQLVTELGTALGLRGTELDHLREGAYLHDLGKLCVPDAILQKPGPLTTEEWQLMQAHTSRGWALARHIPSIAPAVLDVIRHHHERWNGMGYPDALTGRDIPLLARIFAVIDVYDALISERPYKRAWTPEAALEEIEAQAGVQFDPEIVRTFVSLQRQERQFSSLSAAPAAGTPVSAHLARPASTIRAVQRVNAAVDTLTLTP